MRGLLLALIALTVSCGKVQTAIVPPESSGEDAAIAIQSCAANQNPDSFYEENLTYVRPSGEPHPWNQSTPEQQGLDSQKLSRASIFLERSPSVLSFLVARNGYLVYEKYFHGSGPMDANNIHSASKSILSALVGIAIERGEILSTTESIGRYLGKKFSLDKDKKKITINDLLSMKSGISWHEDQTEYSIEDESNWIQAMLDLPQDNKPGRKFNYSTASSHILSAVVSEATGMSTCEFAVENLYTPLDIRVAHWGNDPQGYFSGGYNHYMTPRELLRFSQLYLDAGWNGARQIVPSDWVKRSVTKQASVDREYSYGMQWWLRKIGGHKVAKQWGYGGQLSYVILDLNMIVTMTTDTKNHDDEWDGDRFVEKYLLP